MLTIPPLPSDILAISLDAPASPVIEVDLSKKTGGSHALGWGFGYYPGDQVSALTFKDPSARATVNLADTITDWANFRSTVFFCKVRGASKGYSHTDAQPFSRSFAGRDWMFMHNGDLDKAALDELHGDTRRLLEPLGTTDSELAFINLLAQVREGDARTLSDIDPNRLLSWFQRFDGLGSSDMFFSDGQSVACFQGSQSPKRLYYKRIQPPNNQEKMEFGSARVTLSDPRDTYRTALIVSSSPASGSDWVEFQPGQMIIARRGLIVWGAAPSYVPPIQMPAPAESVSDFNPILTQEIEEHLSPVQAEQARATVTNIRALTETPEGTVLGYRVFDVTHVTHYEYLEPVEHSSHVFRLQPIDDSIQEVVRSSLTISSPSEKIQFEDVFGNPSIHCTIEEPYSKLSVEASARVKIFAAPPDDHSLSRRRTSIPLVWMPWQRQMMMPYLLPTELPESQLLELTDYAMSFVERNDYHLLRTIEDINQSIYRDYQYVPGVTELSTTPFEVYTARRGVCQDFANLFICLARLLSVPARYRMGYIYTGANYANKIQSDASHAWAEVYLPYVGWRGFDPTNGCTVAQDHVRVACGRSYLDATPTSGTIYRGGGTEMLSIDVKVVEVTG